MIIIQAVIPDYRVGFINELRKITSVKIIYGEEYFSNVKTKYNGRPSDSKSKNRYFLGRSFLMQIWPGMWRDIFSKEDKVVELNPRCIITWLCVFSSFFLRRGKTFTWGHRLGRDGKYRSLSLRNAIVFFSNGVIFYTNDQMEEFKSTKLGTYKKCTYAPNSVIHASDVSTSNSNKIDDFIYCGRLVPEKKVELLVKAFINFKSNNVDNISKLHIVGDGPLLSSLKKISNMSDFTSDIVFHGHNSDYDYLKSIYHSCISSVSPGYVGLSITQSFSFGVPMIVAENEQHSPEICCFNDGVNGKYFESNSVDSLSGALNEMYNNRSYWFMKKESISSDIKENYTYEAMASGFISILS